MYTAHAALPLYAAAFEEAGALGKLEAFASFHGPDFYRLPRNKDTVTLAKQAWSVPEAYPFGEEDGPDTLVPMWAGEQMRWGVEGVDVDVAA